MATQTYKILGQQGFEKYDELLRGILTKPPYTTPEQIEELFPEDELDVPNPNDDPDPNSSGNGGGGQQEDPSNLTVNKYIITNVQDASPYATIQEYHDNTLIRTTNVTSTYPYTDINNHLSFRAKGAYNPGDWSFYIYALTNLTWNGYSYSANQTVSQYKIYSENTVLIAE